MTLSTLHTGKVKPQRPTKATWCAQVTRQGRLGVFPAQRQPPSRQGKAQCQPRPWERLLHLWWREASSAPQHCQGSGGITGTPKAVPPKTGDMAATNWVRDPRGSGQAVTMLGRVF